VFGLESAKPGRHLFTPTIHTRLLRHRASVWYLMPTPFSRVRCSHSSLRLITHLPFNGHFIDTKEIADYAGPAIEQAINQVVQVTKMEDINEHISEIRELVKAHLSDFLRTYCITLNDLKVLIVPKDERMRELTSLHAIGLTPLEAVRYYLALRMAEKLLRFRLLAF
jgi:hypothetical protein